MDMHKVVLTNAIWKEVGKELPHPAIQEAGEDAKKHPDIRFIAYLLPFEAVEQIKTWREEKKAACEGYLVKNPKIEWVPPGGWNIGLGITRTEDAYNDMVSRGNIRVIPKG